MHIEKQSKTRVFAVSPPTLDWENALRREAARLGLKPTGFIIHAVTHYFTSQTDKNRPQE